MEVDRPDGGEEHGHDPDGAARDQDVARRRLVAADDAQVAEDGDGEEEAARGQAAEADDPALGAARQRGRDDAVDGKPHGVVGVGRRQHRVGEEEVVDEHEQRVRRLLAAAPDAGRR